MVLPSGTPSSSASMCGKWPGIGRILGDLPLSVAGLEAFAPMNVKGRMLSCCEPSDAQPEGR